MPSPSEGRDTPSRGYAEQPAVAVGPGLPPGDDADLTPLTVRVGEPPEHLFRQLLSAYLAGARCFEVVERPRLSESTRQVVREFCRRTRQPELVRADEKSLEIVERDDCASGALDDRLLSLGQQVLEFHREAVESWDHLSFGDDALWERKDDDIDREAWYLERCIVLGEGRGTAFSRSATVAWTIARSLERIADHAVTLGEVGPRLSDPGSDGGRRRELRQFHRQAMAHLEEVLRSTDGSHANDLLDVGEALVTEGRALSERLLPAVGDGSMTPASAAAVARALEAIGRTVAYSQDIAQAFFDGRLRSRGAESPLRRATPATAPT